MIVYKIRMLNGKLLLDGRCILIRRSDKNKRIYDKLDNKRNQWEKLR
jgi:hypothetical protein